MRAYFFTNMYLSSMQHGIQAQHCTAEMFRKYKKPTKAQKVLHEWADSYKTTMILNGLDSPSMRAILKQVTMFGKVLHLPFSSFCEEGIDNALTCIGIVVPRHVYAVDFTNTGSTVEKKLQAMIRQYSLAR